MSLDHSRYLREAYKAAYLSPDPRTKNGAILVNPTQGSIVSRGYNKFPSKVAVTDERLERPIKYEYIEHAERNAIYNAAAYGVATKGLVIYSPWFPCTDCARAVIQAEIIMVVGHKTPVYETSDHWSDSISIANEMLDEAGVIRHYVEGLLGYSVQFNGELVPV